MGYVVNADEFILGQDVNIGDGVVITAKGGKKAKRITIGDNVILGDNVLIELPELSIGDWTVIHRHTEISGYKEAVIGSCCWVGHNSILNSHGGLYMGNGVGVGAYSQLWTHIRFGDSLQGCRFESVTPMVIEEDVWFVGHCIVSPIHAKRRAMAMAGSVITKDLEENRVYAGVPAVDITDKMGPQYTEVSLEEKLARLEGKITEFYEANPWAPKTIQAVSSPPVDVGEETVFDVATRTYNKRRTPEEIAFMKHLLMTIKFYPR